ncbi:hypothetical protein [Streptomyces hirsutus]|uniref:hypothetical protein n=1 Tax=Streptomyces hirsutus TaxID=35620 RepID=UPI00368DC580
MAGTPDPPETYRMPRRTSDERTAVDWTEAFSRKQQIIREFNAAVLHDDGGPETDTVSLEDLYAALDNPDPDLLEAARKESERIRAAAEARLKQETGRITTLRQERRQSAAAGRLAPDRTAQRPAHGHDQGTVQPPRHRPGP